MPMEDDVVESSSVDVERPARQGLIVWSTFLSLFVAIGFAVHVTTRPGAGIAAVLGPFLLAPVTFFATRWWARPRRLGAVRIVLGEDDVRLVGARSTRTVPYSVVECRSHDAATQSVRLHLATGEVLRMATTAEDAQRILPRLHTGSAAKYALPPSRARAFILALIGGLLGLVGFVGAISLGSKPSLSAAVWVAAFGVGGGILALIVARFRQTHLVIGFDGVRVLGTRPRYVPFAELGEVEPMGKSGVRLHHAGEVIEIPTADPLDIDLIRATRDMAMAESRSHAAFARGTRSLDEWRADLARAAVAGADFRRQPLTRERIDAALQSATATPEQRVGAALALRALDAEAVGARVRIAVSGSADQRLGRALEAAAAGDLDEEVLAAACRQRR